MWALLMVLGLNASGADKGPTRYLALGDSFTIGTGSTPDLCFPSQLKRLLLKRGVDVRLENVAVNGYSTHEVIDRELEALARFKPDTVTLAIGANEQPDWSQSPVAAGFGEPAALRRRIEAYNAILQEEALAVGATFVDLFPQFVEQAKQGLLAPDGLHPSSKAYAFWAESLKDRFLAK